MKRFYKLYIALAVFALVLANMLIIPKVLAGTLTASSVIELGGSGNASPMIVGDGQSLAIAFTTSASGGTGTNPSLTLTFTGWTGGSAGSVNTTQSVSNGSCTTLTGASAGLPGTLSASGSGTVITISSSGGSNSLSASTSYCTELTSTSAVTNPTTAGVYDVTINDSVDSQTDAIDVLSSGANAYTITGTVAPTFTMSLSGASDSFPSNLSATALTVSSGITTTISTNAASGWFVWAEDANAGLKSTSASTTIGTVPTGANQTMNSGTYGPGHAAYGLGVSGSPAYNTANYAYNSGTTGGGLSNSIFNEIATSSSAASNAQFTTHELANITNTTPPATDYTDTITEIGAGSF